MRGLGIVGFFSCSLDDKADGGSATASLLGFGLNVSRLPKVLTFCWKVLLLIGVDKEPVGVGNRDGGAGGVFEFLSERRCLERLSDDDTLFNGTELSDGCSLISFENRLV